VPRRSVSAIEQAPRGRRYGCRRQGPMRRGRGARHQP
jgi:hypothetical protein